MPKLLRNKQMKKKKILIFITVINSLLYNAQASAAGGQNPLDYENNKALNFERDFGVDLYTGTVNINIPLQQLKEDNLSLDLNLNYDATGVLINNVSGIVGQNWNLNAGGSITRKVKGMCFDELENGASSSQPGLGTLLGLQKGFFEKLDFINHDNWNTESNLKTMINWASGASGGYWRMDTEPDIFYFNFFGKSGSFFMGHDGTWKVSSKDNLKVVYNKDSDMVNPMDGIMNQSLHTPYSDYKRKSIGRLTLIDDKGFQYIFGDNDVKSMEIHLGSYFDTNFLWPYVMKWNLKKVVDPNGKIVYNFEYKTGEYLLTNLYTEANFETSSSIEEQNSTTGYSNVDLTDANFWKKYKGSGYFYKPSYLKKINSFTGATADFTYVVTDAIQYSDSGNNLFTPNEIYNRFWRNFEAGNISTDEIPNTNAYVHKHYLLNEIKVSYVNKLVNIINFEYANANPRVFLYKVAKNIDEKYTFLYNNPNSLPGYLSEKTDMWGYYNGYNTAVSTSGRYAFWENFEADKYSTRGSVAPKILYGSLQQITWPTGGSTNFVFEPHSFRQRISSNYSTLTGAVLLQPFANGGGGLRIKKIYDERKERDFFYNNSFDDMDNNISSGILMHEPLFFTRHNVYNLFPDAYNPEVYNSGGTSSANGIRPKSDFFNSNVAYSTAFEKNNDGYIKYTFSDFNDYPDYYVLNGLRPVNKLSKKIDFSFERGMSKSKVYFDSNQNKILENNYSYKNISNLTSRGVDYDFFTANWQYYGLSHPIDPGGFFGIPQPGCMECNSKMDPYLIYYSDKVLDSEITTEYFKDGRKIESLKKYYYKSPIDPSYTLIDKIEDYPNKFDLSKFKTVKFQYPSDMNISSQPFSDMIAKNMIGIPLAVTKYNEAQQPISRTETIFGKNSTTNNFILPVSARTIKTGLNDYANDTSVDTKMTYDLYDGQGHILQYTDASGIPTTLIYGYNKSQPIAKIVGATYNYVNANTNIGYLQDASDVDVDTASENILISLLDDLRKNIAFKDYQITTYTYDPLIGITSLTNPDGLRESYKYDTQSHKLEKVIDVDGKVIEEYKYHYKN
ncbi:hypothetical protein [Chryseobacterium lathyri]|uniref:hypothetical protein n=1 Tax=Chryseobacterium lathyri TaxID=395933 RepID=UPI001CBC4992|nr:hypothetical protein [Chryseobacterium lathyri]